MTAGYIAFREKLPSSLNNTYCKFDIYNEEDAILLIQNAFFAANNNLFVH